ncbi:MAG: hypothetical protein JJ866_18135 [Roseibium sp.]|uniref:hypothetical protein n=1 Tax=Roseibium sp. TaxID=1936156 RepID=UPI001B04BEF0|nr:hypothetical protein [Roseibium sp.]MBO6893864.1 hypothetical protein [Roseibium sp.]MBO6932623.1 hypothetical protein [Roseibium sp.]
MRLNLDVSLFSVVCELGNCLYVPETDLDDMQLDQIIDDIGKGQLENVRAVLEFNPAEGWCNDITADVLAAVPGEDDELHDDDDLADYASERIDGRRAGVKVRVAA